MLQTKENTVKIEGILSEIDIKTGSFTKNGATVESVGGVIKVRVNQDINGVNTELEIPVHLFASKYTNAGAPNPAYESISRVMNEYVSIAASDIDHADRIRITRGQLQMNEYYGQNGNLISQPVAETLADFFGCIFNAGPLKTFRHTKEDVVLKTEVFLAVFFHGEKCAFNLLPYIAVRLQGVVKIFHNLTVQIVFIGQTFSAHIPQTQFHNGFSAKSLAAEIRYIPKIFLQ